MWGAGRGIGKLYEKWGGPGCLVRDEIRYRRNIDRGEGCIDINRLVLHRVRWNVLGIRIITLFLDGYGCKMGFGDTHFYKECPVGD